MNLGRYFAHGFGAISVSVVLAAGLALTGAGCGGTGVSKQSRTEAVSLVREDQRYLTQVTPIIQHEANTLSADSDNCSVEQTTDPSVLPSDLAMQIVDFVGTYKAIAPAYADHARRIRRIAVTDPVFRAAADSAAGLAQRYHDLASAHPGYCRVLKRWHAAGWRSSFDVRPVIGVPPGILDRSGFDRSNQEAAAHEALTKAAARLQHLGASANEARALLLGIDLFHADQ